MSGEFQGSKMAFNLRNMHFLKLLDFSSQEIAKETGARITVTDDLDSGVKGCDFLCADVWVAMGEAEGVWKDRIELLKPYQVNAATMEKTGNPDVKLF